MQPRFKSETLIFGIFGIDVLPAAARVIAQAAAADAFSCCCLRARF
jgi:hypothetical protein